MIAREQIAAMMAYCPETGALTWRVNRTNGVKAGDSVGCVNKDGYIVTSLFGKQYVTHRLIWMLVYGEWRMVDHRDGEGQNNILSNLRPATYSQNAANRKRSGRYLKGVAYSKKDKLWSSRIMKDGKGRHLGTFRSEAEAHAAYCRAAEELYGEFASDGNRAERARPAA